MMRLHRVSGTMAPSLKRYPLEFGATAIAAANSAKTHEATLLGGRLMDTREPPSGGAFV